MNKTNNINQNIENKKVWQVPIFKILSANETGSGSYWTREREDDIYTIPTGLS